MVISSWGAVPSPCRVPVPVRWRSTVRLKLLVFSSPAITRSWLTCTLLSKVPPLFKVRFQNGSVGGALVVMPGLAPVRVMVELPALKVKLAEEEFQAPAIWWLKAPAFQVPRVMVKELVTVQAPTGLTTSVGLALLISRS